jgi:hypothetical protein
MRARFQVVLVFLVAIEIASGFSTNAAAAPIELDNNVDITWSQIGADFCTNFGRCTNDVTVFGAPRLVPNAREVGTEVVFDIDIVSPEYFVAVFLSLQIGDPTQEELLVNDVPLVLTFLADGDEFTTLIGGQTGLAHVRLTLDQFANFSMLPQAADVTFSLSGVFAGSGRACSTCGGEPLVYGATINVNGAGTPLSVSEPASLVLLLAGLGTGLGARMISAPRHYRL